MTTGIGARGFPLVGNCQVRGSFPFLQGVLKDAQTYCMGMYLPQRASQPDRPS